jgi:hypothetical protein
MSKGAEKKKVRRTRSLGEIRVAEIDTDGNGFTLMPSPENGFKDTEEAKRHIRDVVIPGEKRDLDGSITFGVVRIVTTTTPKVEVVKNVSTDFT